MRDKTMITYQGHKIEEEKIETKSTYLFTQSSTKYSRISMKRNSRKLSPTYLTISLKWSILTFITTEPPKDATLFTFWRLSRELNLFTLRQRNLSQLHELNQLKWTWKFPKPQGKGMRFWSQGERKQLQCSLRKKDKQEKSFQSMKKRQSKES